jgi:DNA-binding NarL/FixJ family response regulator
VRVVIAEDNALFREGLTRVLVRGGFEVVAVAKDATELVEEAKRLSPGLVVTDVRMPPSYTDDGLRAALEVRRALPQTAIVVLSQHLYRQYAQELLAEQSAGVGYLLKQRIADIPTFCADLQRVCAGGTVLDPEVVALMMSRARKEAESVECLTGRQLDVLALMAEGKSNAAIARTLSISEKMVVHHTSRIYHELGLLQSDDDHRRVLAVVRYLEQCS